MLIADTVHDNKIVENVQLLQKDCVPLLEELRQSLVKFEREQQDKSPLNKERARPPEPSVDSVRFSLISLVANSFCSLTDGR